MIRKFKVSNFEKIGCFKCIQCYFKMEQNSGSFPVSLQRIKPRIATMLLKVYQIVDLRARQGADLYYNKTWYRVTHKR